MAAKLNHALTVFALQAAGLARYLHDSTSQQARFEEFIDVARAEGSIDTEKHKLDRKNTTRWNSDFRCLEAHYELQGAIRLYLQHEETPNGVGRRFKLSTRLCEILETVLLILQDCLICFFVLANIETAIPGFDRHVPIAFTSYP